MTNDSGGVSPLQHPGNAGLEMAMMGRPGMGGPPMMGRGGMPSGNRPSFRKAFAVFRYRNYRHLWLSSTFSFMGMQMQQIARALLAWQLTESFAATGFVMLSFGLPMLLFSLIGGAVADRVEKRNLTILTQGATGLLALSTGILIFTGLITMEWLYITGFIQGTFFAFGMPARTPLMAEAVGEDDLMSAIAMSNASMNATRLVGPALAGILAATLGLDYAYFTQASMYVFSTALLVLVPTGLAEAAYGGPRPKPEGGMFREIGRGLSYVAKDRTLRLLMAMMFIPTLFAMPYMVLLAGFVQRDLGQGPGAYGLLQSISGIGALVGSLAIATMTDFDRKPLLQWISGIAGGLGLVLLTFASLAFGFPGAIAAIILLGLALTAYQTLNSAMIMDAARPEYFGRVMSINMLTFSVMPLMSAPLGVLADHVGAYAIFVAQGVIVIVSVTILGLLNARYTFGRSSGPAWKREAAEARQRAAIVADAPAPPAVALGRDYMHAGERAAAPSEPSSEHDYMGNGAAAPEAPPMASAPASNGANGAHAEPTRAYTSEAVETRRVAPALPAREPERVELPPRPRPSVMRKVAVAGVTATVVSAIASLFIRD